MEWNKDSVSREWDSVEYDLESEQRGIFVIPNYLDSESYEVIGKIMFSVTGLFFSDLKIPELDIEKTLNEIHTDREKKLWSIYFKEVAKESRQTIH